GGRQGGIFTAAGVAAGQAIWTIATSAGLAAVLVASAVVFRGVRYVGAAYLVFLGIQALAAAARRGGYGPPVAPAAATPALPPRAALRQGMLSNLTNPKMIAFFPALLPQFAPAGHGAFPVLLLLGPLFSSMTLIWLTGYAFAAANAGDLLRGVRVRRLLEAATGVVLIGLGLRLAAER